MVSNDKVLLDFASARKGTCICQQCFKAPAERCSQATAGLVYQSIDGHECMEIDNYLW